MHLCKNKKTLFFSLTGGYSAILTECKVGSFGEMKRFNCAL